MNDQQSSDPVRRGWITIWRLTLALPLFLWCVGFLLSLLYGYSSGEAVPNATAYALSGLVGWLVYSFIVRPWRFLARSSGWSIGVLYAGLHGPIVFNNSLLLPTRPPRTFPEMLVNGLVGTTLGASLMGLMFRLLGRKLHSRLSSAHSLTHAPLNQSLSEVERHGPSEAVCHESDTPKATNG